VHVIACRPIIARGVQQGKEVIAAGLGGQPHEASRMLTFSCV
jgi:hypothetical protein